MSGPDTRPQAIPPVAANIDAEIRRLGLTNLQVARHLDVPDRIVRRWRNPSEWNPNWENLVKFARLCDRSPAWFYEVHEEEPAANNIEESTA